MSNLPSVYVAYIGLTSVTLGGSNFNAYKTSCSEFRGGQIINRFKNESELNSFLQICIDKGVPFSDSIKSNAYQEICQLKAEGYIQGVLKSVTWDINGDFQIS